MANPSKKTLSKNLAQMKFMRRVSQPFDKDESDGSGALIEKWTSPNIPLPSAPEGSQRVQVVNCSFAECENLNKFGRFSYNKFNKEIERLSHQSSKGPPNSDSDEDEGTISALEVAKRYEAITSRKLLGKRRRSDNGNELDRISERSKSVDRKRMDKDGFIKP